MEQAEEGVEPEKKEEERADERESLRYWLRWVKKSRDSKGAKRHRENAKRAWAEYEKVSKATNKSELGLDSRASGGTYPIYWSSVDTLLPAYISKTPQTLADRAFGIDDEVAMTASLGIERLSRWGIRGFQFDETMRCATLDYIHADKSTVQLIYDAEMEEQEIEVPLRQVTEEIFVDTQGAEWEGEIFSAGGRLFGKEVKEVATNQKVYLKPVLYDEIIHTPSAKSWDEIDDLGLYFCMTREKAERRFGEEVTKHINWKSQSAKGSGNRGDVDGVSDEGEEITGEFLEGWECWSDVTKRVYWVSEQHPDKFLDKKDDPYKLKGFFPVPPFIIGSKPAKSLYPTPTYMQLAAIIEQLHEIAEKVYDLIDGIERRAIVDGDSDLVDALNQTSNMYVVAKNLTNLLEKGGIEKMVWFVPVQELVQAITELNALEERFKAQFYEFFGLPDILRGQTEQYVPAATDQQAAAAAHDRFKYKKKQVKQLARDGLEMMIDLMLQVFDEQKLAGIMGLEYTTPEHQQRFGAALQLLKDDDIRSIRIEIETDTMSFMDDQLKQQQVNKAVMTVTQGLQNVTNMLANAPDNPHFAEVGLLTILESLETIAPGRQFQDKVKSSVNFLIDKMKNPPPPPPPPPDYEMLKLQQKDQENQLKHFQKEREFEQRDYKMAMQAQKDAFQMQIDEREVGVKELKYALEAQRDQFAQQMEAMQFSMEEMASRFAMQAEAERILIEQFKAQTQAAESFQEEVRLARSSNIELVRAAADFEERAKPQIIHMDPPEIPPITIQMPQQKARKRRVFSTYDENGNATHDVTDVAGDEG